MKRHEHVLTAPLRVSQTVARTAIGQRVQINVAWPVDVLGQYGDRSIPLDEDRMDAWVHANVDTRDPAVRIVGICPGRTAQNVPVIVVTLSTMSV